MIYGAETLYSDIDYYRLVTIAGARGAGKDLLACHLSVRYLEMGYKFYSNQFHVWNDPLYKPDGEPDVKRRVIVLTEAGRYLRRYEYMEDLIEFARKLKSYFFFPSVRLPHVDLQVLTIFPVMPFKPLIGIEGGLWGWSLNSGFSPERRKMFLFLPEKRYIGIYDTEDYSENPDYLLQAVRRYVENDQRQRGRNGIQKVDTGSQFADEESFAAIERRIQQSIKTVSGSRR